MPTNPIKPTEPSQSTPPPQPTTIAQGQAVQATKTDKPPAKITAGLTIPKVQSKPSPLKEQHRDTRGQPDYSPVVITILNGAYKGKSVDLGLAVNEVSHSETAEWEAQDGDGIRVGVNFKRLSPREISLSLTYYSAIEDVSHLVESLKHLKEITEGEARPPLLLFSQGSLRATECVCTSVRDRYSEPHPGRRGLRRADVEVTLLLSGGKNSSYSAGSPLVSTPLGDERSRQTEAERQKRGQQIVVQKLLAPCLGEQGSAALTAMIEKDQFGDASAIAKLEPATFVQAAIAGMLPKHLLKNELRAKLRENLALVLASKEDGLRALDVRGFANALLSGDESPLMPYLQEQFPVTKADFELINDALANQELGEDSIIFDPKQSATAGERLRRFGNCGLDLRRSGAAKVAATPPDKSNAEILKEINEFFGAKPSDAQIRDRFGISDAAVNVSALRNGAPYQSPDEFFERAATSNKLINGMYLWASFEAGGVDAIKQLI